MKNLITFAFCMGWYLATNAQQTIALVEQFTGFKCEHCPNAQLLMDSLENEFQDSVVFVSIHTGIFAEPNSSGTTFLDELRISEGSDYYQFCDPVGLPSAMVSRKPNASNPPSVAHLKNEWRSKISEVVALPKLMDIQLTYTYDGVNNVFSVTTQNEALATLNGDYTIVYYLIEDNVLTDQITVGGATISNFAQQHVLRDVLNGTWGDVLFSGVTSVGTIQTHNVQYTPAANISNLNACSLIAYVRDAANNEIIQVAKLAIQGLPLGLNDLETQEAVVLYPNPTSDKIQCLFSSDTEARTIQLLDQTGRILLEQEIISGEQLSIDVSELGQGTYILRALDAVRKEISSHKIVKI